MVTGDSLDWDCAAVTTSKESSRSAGLSTPIRGIARPADAQLGGPLQALLDARAGDDRVPIAEAQPGPEGTVLVPEAVELPAAPPHLPPHPRGVLPRETAPRLRAPLPPALALPPASPHTARPPALSN